LSLPSASCPTGQDRGARPTLTPLTAPSSSSDASTDRGRVLHMTEVDVEFATRRRRGHDTNGGAPSGCRPSQVGLLRRLSTHSSGMMRSQQWVLSMPVDVRPSHSTASPRCGAHGPACRSSSPCTTVPEKLGVERGVAHRRHNCGARAACGAAVGSIASE
jgi:hypothetical protein